MTPTPTGRIEQDGDRRRLVLTRTFSAPAEDVWAAVTQPDRLARWIGTFTGDPVSGRVLFRMTAEEGAPEEDVEIRACEPPSRLWLTFHVGEDAWSVDLDLAETDGVTTLTFAQPVDPAQVENVGPGWEYYLDRLVAAETGGDPDSLDFDRDYYPAMAEHYRAQV